MSESDHPLAALGGTWHGAGDGEYPTIAAFAYFEELVVAPVLGRPLAHWRSTTREAATGQARHAESGFLRATPSGVELVVAHGFGVVEAAAGTFDGAALRLHTTGLIATASAKQVEQIERYYQLDGDVLRYTIAMAAVGVELTHHLPRRIAPLTTTARRSPRDHTVAAAGLGGHDARLELVPLETISIEVASAWSIAQPEDHRDPGAVVGSTVWCVVPAKRSDGAHAGRTDT